jgi:hypothetical protein
VAASRDQADVLRRQAEQLVKRSGEQIGTFSWAIGNAIYDVKTGYREIRYGDSRMRILMTRRNRSLSPSRPLKIAVTMILATVGPKAKTNKR